MSIFNKIFFHLPFLPASLALPLSAAPPASFSFVAPFLSASLAGAAFLSVAAGVAPFLSPAAAPFLSPAAAPFLSSFTSSSSFSFYYMALFAIIFNNLIRLAPSSSSSESS